jgi:hypothetical protein
MKINSDYLFIAAFLVGLGPWLVYAFWVFHHMWFNFKKSTSGMRGLNPLQWRRSGFNRKTDPEAQRLMKNLNRWLKICFLTWGVSFVLLFPVMFVLDRLGLLANPTSTFLPKPSQGAPSSHAALESTR